MLYSVLVSVGVLLAAALIGLVLIQQGKGAGMGAAFGAGASGTVFGSRGSASFLSRSTAILAALFFINTIVLAYLASNRPVSESIVESAVQQEVIPENAPELPETLNLPDGASNEEMMEAIKKEIEKQAGEPSSQSDVPNVSEQEFFDASPDDKSAEIIEEIESKTNQSGTELPSDVPQ